ncbi:TatD family hydrolase [Prevotella sp. PCHR]|uniref:TatD family hydrolase n=1 Tax=Xylanibacter caecicola TaxID=2736294 RepID=A0ABX2B0Q6_9BACT|nr:TatD family hydrolase [Xylanibacter caecicola]NPE25001.1 TatD family hydrolase [Xylanibacter caecicola]
MTFTDTHIHLDGTEFDADRDEVVARAREAGVGRMFVPAIDLASVDTVLATCRRYPGYAYPMIGLHPEEVKEGWQGVLAEMKQMLQRSVMQPDACDTGSRFIAVGEVGIDYYWSREYEKEQLEVFEEQVRWSVEYGLPLMIHCRKGQNEMVKILRRYEKELPGGVFHCFTGNEKEAAELLSFDRFVLGVGGVLTFKKSHLPEVIPSIPADRIVIETDAPYMAPVPMRGKRNESAYARYVLERMAECYGMPCDELAAITEATVDRVFFK